MNRELYCISHIVKIMGLVRFTIVLFFYTLYCCDLLQYPDGSKDIISCYAYEGKGAFDTAVNVCRNFGGYLVEIGNAAENQAIASKTLIARFMGPTWGPSRPDRIQVGPMWAP